MPYPNDTLKADGSGDYTTMSSWESATQGLFDATEPCSLTCYDGDYGGTNGALSELVYILGWPDPTPTNNVTITVADGNWHEGVLAAPDSMTGFKMRGGGTSIDCQIPNVTIERLTLLTDTTSNTKPALLLQNGGTDTIVNQCIILASSNRAYGIYTRNTASGTIATNIISNCRTGFITQSGGAVATYYNCLAFGAHGFVSEDLNTDTFINCSDLSGDNFAAAGFAPGSTNNASSGASSVGPNPQVLVDIVNPNVDYIDPVNLDFNPEPGGKLDNTGVNQSTEFTVDITDATRAAGVAPWEIGPYEIAGAAPGVTFDGPDIVAQSGLENDPFSFDENGEGTVASRFTGATSYALSPDSDALPAGMSVNATTGNLEGTPTEAFTSSNIIIRGSD